LRHKSVVLRSAETLISAERFLPFFSGLFLCFADERQVVAFRLLEISTANSKSYPFAFS